MIVTLQVNAPPGQAIGIKEAIAQDLEKYGDVRVVAVEGNALHHCVGTYGKKHANGSTAIFFIRRASRPNEPWYTLELDEKKLEVRQNRGKHNCARVPEVQAFENKWLAWVWAGAPRGQDGKPVLPQARVRAA